MGDRLAHHECADQVLDGSSLAAVGPEVEGVQTSVEGGWFKKSGAFWFNKKFLPLGTQLVQDGDVGVGVVDVVGVRGVLMPRPFVRSGHICTCKMVEKSIGTADQCQTWSSQALTRRPHCRIQIRVAGSDGGPGESWGRSLDGNLTPWLPRVYRHLEERLKEALEDVLEVIYAVVGPGHKYLKVKRR